MLNVDSLISDRPKFLKLGLNPSMEKHVLTSKPNKLYVFQRLKKS